MSVTVVVTYTCDVCGISADRKKAERSWTVVGFDCPAKGRPRSAIGVMFSEKRHFCAKCAKESTWLKGVLGL